MKIQLQHVLIANIALFIIVALVHLVRAVFQVPLRIGAFYLPFWVSAVAAVLIACLAFLNWEVMPQKSHKTVAELLLIFFMIVLALILGLWASGREFLGISGFDYLIPAVFDFIIIILLLWYLQSKYRLIHVTHVRRKLT